MRRWHPLLHAQLLHFRGRGDRERGRILMKISTIHAPSPPLQYCSVARQPTSIPAAAKRSPPNPDAVDSPTLCNHIVNSHRFLTPEQRRHHSYAQESNGVAATLKEGRNKILTLYSCNPYPTLYFRAFPAAAVPSPFNPFLQMGPHPTWTAPTRSRWRLRRARRSLARSAAVVWSRLRRFL